MAERAIMPATVPATYAELRRAVEVAMVQGQQAIDLAKVRTYHETGRLIREHLLAHQDRADYGTKTFQRLAADLKVDRSVLQRCDQFYRAFPICATWHKLTWAHYRVLLPVEDTQQRRALAAEADRNAWSVVQLEQRVRALAPAPESDAVATAAAGGKARLLVPRRGTPGLHLVVERGPSASRRAGEGLAVDLGFKLYRGPAAGSKLAAGDIVRFAAGGSLRRVEEATKAELFTYDAMLRRVVDGDTLVVALEVAPEIFLELKLRLRGLDCPELSTPEGKAEKRFVDGLVAKATALVLSTTKPDKYDRYLADVFLMTDAGETYLNNALLENGHAVRKDAWEFRDWEPELFG